MADRHGNWTGVPRAAPRLVLSGRDDFATLADADPELSFLARGKGRSHGDVCLNRDGILIDTAELDWILALDDETGVLRAEAGVTLAEILDVAVPRGWFLPVTSDTRFVTLGGAIANDVHGKNHDCAGTFGRHVARLCLRRSDGSSHVCSLLDNVGLFRATIGGLGLTGLIVWAEIRLRPMRHPWLDTATHRIADLDEYFALNAALVPRHEYTVAWIDCVASGKALGRGIYTAADHAPAGATGSGPERHLLGMPRQPLFPSVTRFTVSMFNALRFHWPRRSRAVAHFGPWLHPLDRVGNWNRLCGRRGFARFQCVVPHATARDAIRDMLRLVARRGQGAFLAALKTFGDMPSPGLLSFPMPGITLAVDVVFRGAPTRRLLDDLYAISWQAGGRIYPAADAHAPPDSLRAAWPAFGEFQRHIDPRFRSDLWRRLGIIRREQEVPSLSIAARVASGR